MISIITALYYTLPFCVFSTSESSIVCDKEKGVIKVQGNSLKILQLTDLHVNGALDMPLTFSVIKRLVKESNPDLIVVTGDVFSSGCSEKDVAVFTKFMSELGLP